MPVLKRKMDAFTAMKDPMLGSMIARHMKVQASGRGGDYQFCLMGTPMPPKIRSFIEAGVRHHANKYNCKPSDLIWKVGFVQGRAMPVLHIHKRHRVEVS